MSKLLCAGLAVLFITGSSFLAYAPAPAFGAERDKLSATELDALTDARVAIVKGALQLTPEQEKHWPAVEEAIRFRATGRQARAAKIAARADELRDRNAIEVLRDRNPIDFMRRMNLLDH